MQVSKILVVDDNSANRALAQATLEDEGYEVILASNGEEGLRQVDCIRVDCVLLDVRMPNMDGFEVCRRIRARATDNDLPIIFLTAQRDVETFDAAREAGGDDFLTKPLEPAALLVRVQAALKLRRVGQELRVQYDLVRQQRDDLMRMQLLKERLTALLVHDLKNPVSSMDLRAQQALRDPTLSDSARGSILHIRDETRTLLRLILNLLDISRSDEGVLRARAEGFDLGALADEVVGDLELKARLNAVHLEQGIPAMSIRADQDLLRRLLANLVENAIRHAPEQSVVRVNGRVADGQVQLEVSDEGPGVPNEMVERIFDPFVQLEGEADRAARAGRGLGLTYCRIAAQAHGGTIRVQNTNPGACFLVTLPQAFIASTQSEYGPTETRGKYGELTEHAKRIG